MEIYLITLVLICLTNQLQTNSLPNEKELVYLQLLTTNGVFSPLQLYPKDPNPESIWPDGLGELTKLGKIQQFELGKVIRKDYEHFITSSPSEIDAFSSAEDRSTHSLLCFLASFYAPSKEWEFFPDFHWQPIPISYLDTNDTFLRYPENCLVQIMERKNFYRKSPGKDFIQRDKFLYSYWSNNSGADINNWNDVAMLYDALDKEKRFGYKIPLWAKKHWKDLERVATSAYTWNYQSASSLRMKVGNIINLMVLRMQAKMYEPDPIKVSVYMTHDWNMAAFLIASGLYNGHRPPPCATIAIEMYHHKQDDQYSVRMLFYNSTRPESRPEKSHLLKLIRCSEYCPLQSYVHHYEDLTSSDFFEICPKFIESEEELNKYLKEEPQNEYYYYYK